MEQQNKRLLIVSLIIGCVFMMMVFKDYYCFKYKDEAKNISIDECGKKEYLEEKYSDYLKKTSIDYYFPKINISPNTSLTFPNYND